MFADKNAKYKNLTYNNLTVTVQLPSGAAMWGGSVIPELKNEFWSKFRYTGGVMIYRNKN